MNYYSTINLTEYKSNKKQKRKEKKWYPKEKAAEHYLRNEEAIKEKSKNLCKNLSEEERDIIEEYQIKRYQELIQFKKSFAFADYKKN